MIQYCRHDQAANRVSLNLLYGVLVLDLTVVQIVKMHAE